MGAHNKNNKTHEEMIHMHEDQTADKRKRAV